MQVQPPSPPAPAQLTAEALRQHTASVGGSGSGAGGVAEAKEAEEDDNDSHSNHSRSSKYSRGEDGAKYERPESQVVLHMQAEALQQERDRQREQTMVEQMEGVTLNVPLTSPAQATVPTAPASGGEGGEEAPVQQMMFLQLFEGLRPVF